MTPEELYNALCRVKRRVDDLATEIQALIPDGTLPEDTWRQLINLGEDMIGVAKELEWANHVAQDTN